MDHELDFETGITAEFDLFALDLDLDPATIQDLETVESFESDWTAPAWNESNVPDIW